MSVTLYFHPLSSFCQKVTMALYENDTPFTPHLVDLGNAEARAAFQKVWPLAKFPVLRDDTTNQTIPESSVIIEYLQRHFPGKTRFIPSDPDLAWQTHLQDRFFDLHMNTPMQKIVTDRLRPAGQNDKFGVEQAQASLKIACDILEAHIAGKTWAIGDTFSMADCAAAPALFYTNMVIPLDKDHKNVAAYLKRLMARPSYARALKEAEPYLSLVPK